MNGDCNAEDPDYLNAARNGQKLIFKTFGKMPTQLHTHSPYALRVDVLETIEKKYARQFEQTASNKFRNINDISVTSFLFNHYTYLSGNGIFDKANVILIKSQHNYQKKFSELLNQRQSADALSVCINDGSNSHENCDWNIKSLQFLESYFPNPSEFEK